MDMKLADKVLNYVPMYQELPFVIDGYINLLMAVLLQRQWVVIL